MSEWRIRLSKGVSSLTLAPGDQMCRHDRKTTPS
jgi:hypothetical protein